MTRNLFLSAHDFNSSHFFIDNYSRLCQSLPQVTLPLIKRYINIIYRCTYRLCNDFRIVFSSIARQQTINFISSSWRVIEEKGKNLTFHKYILGRERKIGCSHIFKILYIRPNVKCGLSSQLER